MFKKLLNLSKRLLTIGLSLISMAVLSPNALGHNGAVAFATPVTSIEVDGELGDWPPNIKVHPIEKAEFGDQPDGDKDLAGQFRVGYDVKRAMLYVAVEVTDSSVVRDDDAGHDWSAQDGCAIYIDRQQIKNGLQATQYFRFGPELRIHGSVDEQDASRAAKVHVAEGDGKRVYEWQVPLHGAIGPGVTLGFDVDITDRDDDDSFTWMAWGSGTQKVHYLGRLGHLHLVAEDDPMELVRVTGSVRLKTPKEGEESVVPPVSIQSTTMPSLWTLVGCDESGEYSTELPVGTYRVSPVDSSGLRVDETTTIECKLVAGRDTKADVLVVPNLESPNLIGDTTVLGQKKFDSHKIDRFVAAYQDYHHVPGVSLAIITDGEVRYCKKYGVKNAISKEPMQDNTVFEACSLTKPVFAYAVNRLAEKGVLDFATPLYKYKPVVAGYEDVVNDDRFKLITAQHVLAHRTGFPNWRSEKLTIDFEPGQGYGYSGEGFELLGAIVSHLTGKDLVDVIDEEVFAPLGIENAHLVWNDVLAERTARGHILGASPIPKTRNYQPGMAHSLHIDAENYAKLLIAILKRKGLSKSTYDNMLNQQFEVADPENPHEYPYCLGMVVEDTPQGKKYSHTGVNTGWRCRFGLFDDLELGYVVFTNSDRGDQFAEDLEQFLVTGPQATNGKK